MAVQIARHQPDRTMGQVQRDLAFIRDLVVDVEQRDAVSG